MAENTELLDFADLVRARQAVPAADERQRVLDRVKSVEADKAKSKPVSRKPWKLFMAVGLAAAAAFAVRMSLFSDTQSTRTTFEMLKRPKSVVVESGWKPHALNVAVGSSSCTTGKEKSQDEFAGVEFPQPELRQGQGASAVESTASSDNARLLRVHGLAMMQTKGEARWRVCERGAALKPGDTIRTSKRLESSVRILSPDGSAISIAAGASAVYRGPRGWLVERGNAYFDVASRKDLDAFTVGTQHGQARAMGTRFALDVHPDHGQNADGLTLCRVEDGVVALSREHANETLDIAAGKAAVMTASKLEASDKMAGTEWLKVLELEANSDHGIGQLVANADKANMQMPLEIKSHHVTVTVIDQVARTSVDAVFVNNSDRRLEGTFYYPLPADATISEFAMYVGSQRIVGEVLEQQRARQIFEYIVRQQKDPALLEYAGGNLFKMRVFPIEPHSEKRVQLGYTQILPRSSGKVTYTYPLFSEMLIKNPLHALTIECRVLSSLGITALASPTHLAPAAISTDGKRGALAFNAAEYSPTRDFTVTYNVPDPEECTTFANLRPDDPDGYFMVQLCPKVEVPAREAPQRLVLVVDGSASAGPQEYAVATEFAASAADVSSNWLFGLIRGGQNPNTFGTGLSLAADDTSSKLRDFLTQAPPLGATDLLLTFKEAAKQIKPGEPVQIVYVGDGVDTVSELSGPALVAQIAALFKGLDVKLSTVAVGSNYDSAVLQGLAGALGGTFTHVEGATDVHSAVNTVFESFYKPVLWDVRASFENVPVKNVYSEYIGTVASGDTAVLLGRFDSAHPRGTLHLTANVPGQNIDKTYPINLKANEQSNRFLPRLWAKAHIDAKLASMGMGADDAPIKNEIIQSSITYQIMSAFTAFLVLESEEDYAKYGIKRSMKMWDWNGGDLNVARDSGAAHEFKKTESAKDSLFFDEPELAFSPYQESGRGGDAPSSSPVGRAFGDKKRLLSNMAEEISGDPSSIDGDDAKLGDHFETLDLQTESESRLEAMDEISYADDNGLKQKAQSFMSGKSSYRRSAGNERSLRALSVGGIARMDRAYQYGYEPQYGSLVFVAGKIVDLVVDQPLRSTVDYRRLLTAGKGDLSTQLNLALAFESEGRFSDALKAILPLVPLLEKLPCVVDVRLEEAVLRFRSGDAAGGQAAFDKALSDSAAKGADPKEQASLRERIASLLSQISQPAASAKIYAELARSSTTPEEAAPRAQNATYNFRNAGQPDESRALWEELLKRWPENTPLMGHAGSSILPDANGTERGLELLKAASKLEPVFIPQLIGAYQQLGRREELRAVCSMVLEKPANANDVYSALAALAALGSEVAANEAIALLNDGKSAFQLTGATQYFYSYGALRNQTQIDALLKAAARADLPAQARINAFYALYNVRRGTSMKTQLLHLLSPLCEAPRTSEEFAFALQGIQMLHNYSYSKEAESLIAILAGQKNLPENTRAALELTRLNVLVALGRGKEAEEASLVLFSNAKSENDAYAAAWRVFTSRIGRHELESAAEITEAFAKRYPAAVTLPQFYQQLLQQMRQTEKADDAAALIERLAKTYPENAMYLSLHAKLLASKGKWRDAAESIREALKLLDRPVPPTPEKKAPPPENNPGNTKVKEPTEAELTKAREAAAELEARARFDKRLRLIQLLARIASQDTEFRAEFLKECDANARSEDPAAREWTEAALSGLHAAGEMDAYLQRLKSLAAAEPADPLWTRRLGGALISAKKFKEGLAILSQISDSEPDDSDLAMALYEINVKVKDEKAAVGYFERAFNAMASQSGRLEQFGSEMQQQNPEWALKAWKYLVQKEIAAGTANLPGSRVMSLSYQIAQTAQQLGRESEAADYYLQSIQTGQGEYAPSALSSLTQLCQKEEILRAIEPRVHTALDRKPDQSRGIALNLLLSTLEKQKGKNESSLAALKAASEVDLPQNNSNLGNMVVQGLIAANQKDAAEAYALQGGGKLNADQRQQLIRNTQSAFNSDSDRPRVLRLIQVLLAAPGNNSEGDRERLVSTLIAMGQLDQAGKEVRSMDPGQNPWSLYNAWNNVIQAHLNLKHYGTAVNMAMESWRKLNEDSQGYRGSAFNTLLNTCRQALTANQLDDETLARVKTELRTSAKRYFESGQQSDSYLSYWHNSRMNEFGLDSEFEALARDAGKSDDLVRVTLAAQYLSQTNRAEGRALYRRALQLPGADERTILQQLYGLYSNTNDNSQTDWGDAIDVLERLYTLKTYNEDQYFVERGRCLYGLNRKDEAREAIRKLLARPSYWRQGYYNVHNLAYICQNAKDWQMAAEAWELSLKLVRQQTRGRQFDMSSAGSAYQNCARAYAEAGEKDKALDCYLRGMSVMPRDNAYYQQLLRDALKEVLNGKAIDHAVAEYENNLATNGGAERPHLRLAFAEAYKQGRQPGRMLANLRIAANLLPKDMKLRQEVIDGYKQLHENDTALACYFEWAKLDPQNIEIYRGLGDTYENLGRHADALLAWATMAEVRPREAEGYRAYAQKLQGIKEYEKAAAALRHALRYRPTEFDIAKELADAYAQLKQNDKIPALWADGEKACRAAIENLPDDPQPWLNLGKYLSAAGNPSEAQALYTKILQRQWPRFQRETYDEARKQLK